MANPTVSQSTVFPISGTAVSSFTMSLTGVGSTDMLLAYYQADGTSQVTGVTNTGTGGTWTKAAGLLWTGNGLDLDVWAGFPPSGGWSSGSITVTVAVSAADNVSGMLLDIAGALSIEASMISITNNGETFTSPSITPSTTGDLVLAAYSQDTSSAGPTAPASPWTVITGPSGAAVGEAHNYGGIAYQAGTAGTSYQATWTNPGGTSNWLAASLVISSSPPPAAIVIQTSTFPAHAGSNVLTTQLPTLTAGNTLVAAVAGGAGDVATSLTGGTGTTWTKAVGVHDSGDVGDVEIWVGTGYSSSASTVTFTVTYSSSEPGMVVWELSGKWQVDVFNTSQQSSVGNIACTVPTMAAAGEPVFAIVNANSAAANADWPNSLASNPFTFVAQWETAPSATGQSATWTQNPANDVLTAVLALKPVTSGTSVAGSVSATTTVAGAATEKRAITGVVTGATEVAGQAALKAVLTGAVTAASSVGGTVKVTAVMVGAITAATAVAGSATASLSGALAGSATALSSAAGVLGSAAASGGSASASSAVTGTASEKAALAGGTTATTGTTGTPHSVAALLGSTIASSGGSAVALEALAASGSSSSTSSVTGALGASAAGSLQGSAAAATTVAGSPHETVALSGSVSATSQDTGAISSKQALTGSAQAVTSATGAAQAAGSGALQGVAQAATTVTGQPSSVEKTSGAVTATSSVGPIQARESESTTGSALATSEDTASGLLADSVSGVVTAATTASSSGEEAESVTGAATTSSAVTGTATAQSPLREVSGAAQADTAVTGALTAVITNTTGRSTALMKPTSRAMEAWTATRLLAGQTRTLEST